MSFNKWKYNVNNTAELLSNYKVVKVVHNSVNALRKDVAPVVEQVAPAVAGMNVATPTPSPVISVEPVAPIELPKAPEAVVEPFTPQPSASEPIGPVATTAQTEMKTAAIPSLEPLNTTFGEMPNKGLTDDAGNSLLKPIDIKEEMNIDTPAPSLPQEIQVSSIDSIISNMIESGMAPELDEIREAITALKSSIAEMRAKLDELEKQYEAVEGLNKAVIDSANRIDTVAKEPMQTTYATTPQPMPQVGNAPFEPQPYVPGQSTQQLRAA